MTLRNCMPYPRHWSTRTAILVCRAQVTASGAMISGWLIYLTIMNTSTAQSIYVKTLALSPSPNMITMHLYFTPPHHC